MSIQELVQTVEMSPQEWSSVLQQGAVLRLPFLEGQQSHAQDQIQQYEQKYNTTFPHQGLPDDADYAMHEDYIEWEFWMDKLQRVEADIDGIRAILRETED